VLAEHHTDEIREQLHGFGHCSVLFDGTTRIGELIAVVARVVDDNLVATHRLLLLETVDFSVDSARLAGVLASGLHDHGIDRRTPTFVVATIHDSASVNRAAMRLLVCYIVPSSPVHGAVSRSLLFLFSTYSSCATAD
jgi:hypothetical protein